MSLFFFSQLLAALALCSDLISFQCKQRLHILFCFILSCSLLSIHFLCLAHWTAASLAFFGALRYIVSFFSTRRYHAVICLAGILLLTVLTWEGLLSLLAAAGSVSGTVAAFCKEDKQLRQIMFFCTVFWILHNILAGSPTAVLVEAVFMGSNCIGYFRYYILPNRC